MKKTIESHTLYAELDSLNLLQHRPKYWWPGAGSFEVIVGAILTQNTTWKNVERSLQNLEGCLRLESFLKLSEEQLKERIRPSGFYNQKAPRLLTLSKNIAERFQTFERFQHEVTREWLLEQKGVGPETADSILCYACFRREMVVDTYIKRWLRQYDIILPNYHTYKAFLEEGIRKHYQQDDINLIFARFHGMVVEYNKKMKLKP